MKILLIGRNQWVVDGAKKELDSESLTVLGALSIDDVRKVLRHNDIDHAFIGPGLDLDVRLECVRAIVTHSSYTTVHLKDHSTGPEGGLRFVKGVLTGLADTIDTRCAHRATGFRARIENRFGR